MSKHRMKGRKDKNKFRTPPEGKECERYLPF